MIKIDGHNKEERMSKKYRRIKKTLALTLALVMVLGILPLGSVASASPPNPELEIPGLAAVALSEAPDLTDPEVLPDLITEGKVTTIQFGSPALIYGFTKETTANLNFSSTTEDVAIASLGTEPNTLRIDHVGLGVTVLRVWTPAVTDGTVFNLAELFYVVRVVPGELNVSAATLVDKTFNNTASAAVKTVTFTGIGAGEYDVAPNNTFTFMGETFTATAENFTSPDAGVSQSILVTVGESPTPNFTFTALGNRTATVAAQSIGKNTDYGVVGIPADDTVVQVDTIGPFNQREASSKHGFDGVPEFNGLLTWFVDATPGLTPTSPAAAIGAAGIPTGTMYVWYEFEPFNPQPANFGTTAGYVAISVYSGVLLPDTLLHVPGVGSDGITATYDGFRKGVISPNAPYVEFPNNFNFTPFPTIGNITNANELSKESNWKPFTVTYSGTMRDGENYPSSTTAPTDAGDYVITIDKTTASINLGSGASTYRIIKTIKLTIEPLQLEWGTGIVPDKVYDGTTEITLNPRFLFSNAVGNDDVKITNDSLRFASARVGTHPLIVGTGFNAELTGDEAHNYIAPTGAPMFGFATINPRNVTVIPNVGEGKFYRERDGAIGFSVLMDNNAVIPSNGTPFANSQAWFDYFNSIPTAGQLQMGTDFTQWIGRVPGNDVGFYPYLLNEEAIGPNFNVSFPSGMSRSYEVKPAIITGFDSVTIPRNATLTAYEAYATWRSATSAPMAANAQALVDLAVSMDRLPAGATMNTNAKVPADRWSAPPGSPTGKEWLPMNWTTRTGLMVGTNDARGGSYVLSGSVDTSETKNVVNPDAIGTYGTLTVTEIEFPADPTTLHSVFGNAHVLLVPGVTEATASNPNLSHLLPTSGTLMISGAPVPYTVAWDSGPKLNLSRPDSAKFTGKINFPDAELIPWFTVPPATQRDVSRTINSVNTLPIVITYGAGGWFEYTAKPWDPGVLPRIEVNGVPVTDHPSDFNWSFTNTDTGVTRTTPPVDAGNYTVTISVEAYGVYGRYTRAAHSFTIGSKNVELIADDDSVPQGKYVDGGLPSLSYSIKGLIDGDTHADVMKEDPTLRIRRFNGNVLGDYVLEFVSPGVERTGPKNYNVTNWIDGTITVVTPDAPTYKVSVAGGTLTGGGSFAELTAGTVVTITANDPPSGREFIRWSANSNVSFANANSPITTFVMPAREVVISATFDRIPTSTTPVIPKEPIFPDLTSGPAFNAVQWAATMRIIEGRDGLFHPKAEMTRSQIVVILHRYAGRENVSATVSFTDVTPGTTIGRAVAWAVSNDIATGRSSTVFGVNDIISRESLMVMLYRYHTRVLGNSGAASANALARFSDSGDVSSTALNAIRWAVENGLLTGQGGKILPKASMTRDQLVTILYRYDKAFN
jgi:hypothetical protein